MEQSITVAIVTRNRANDLRDCLESLVRQTLIPKNILIVNNNSTDQTEKVIQRFTSTLPVRTVVEKKTGYPVVYNRALQEVKTRWIAFIDDDCAADKRWYSEVVKATKRFKGHGAIAGSSLNYYPDNVYACAFQFSYEYWRLRSIDKTSVLDYRALDSRNIIYNTQLLSRLKIAFDEVFAVGAEDSDIGLQIQENGLQAAYVKDVIVHHKEPTSWRSFWRKKKNQAKALRLLTQKWSGKMYKKRSGKRIRDAVSLFMLITRQLSFGKRFFTLLLVITDFVLARFRFYRFI